MAEIHEGIDPKRLKPHSKNPRIGGTGSVMVLTKQMKESGFQRHNRIVVRPLDDGSLQIICGHRRVAAAKKAGIAMVPCEIRRMTDEQAYMLLRSDNAHQPLSPIEGGLHFLESNMSRRDYARVQGLKEDDVKDQAEAARVYSAIRKLVPLEDIKRWRVLTALRPASAWLWPFWGPRAVRDEWKIEQTNNTVRDCGHVNMPPAWADAEKMAAALLSGILRPAHVDEMHRLVEAVKDKARREVVIDALSDARPSTPAEARTVINRALSDGEPVEEIAPDDAVEDLFPASEDLLEAYGPTLEEQHDDHLSRHIGRRALKALDKALKLPGEPTPEYGGLSSKERRHRCEQIDRLIEWLQRQRRELAGNEDVT